MKNLFKAVMTTFLIGIFMVTFQPEAKAWKLFGWEITKTRHVGPDGKCYFHVDRDFYFLGINFGGGEDGFEEADCSGG